MLKPEPVPKSIVCSLCGLDWKRHDAKQTVEKCIELLKADLASAQQRSRWNQQGVIFTSGGYSTGGNTPTNPSI
jgi:hypothetical protein